MSKRRRQQRRHYLTAEQQNARELRGFRPSGLGATIPQQEGTRSLRYLRHDPHVPIGNGQPIELRRVIATRPIHLCAKCQQPFVFTASTLCGRC
jgi:hypothetical protein